MNTDNLANETWASLVDPLSRFCECRSVVARRIHDEVEDEVFAQVDTESVLSEIIDQFGSTNKVWRYP
jgi:hypothetical protein